MSTATTTISDETRERREFLIFRMRRLLEEDMAPNLAELTVATILHKERAAAMLMLLQQWQATKNIKE